ncbi:2060_t:CDS:2 [Funneliformis geosporum]|nr:2060_t:CDS:2 [Funneliformis geosporum]
MSLLITFEGIDGSGKTTLINNLKKSVELDLITHNWRDTELGQKIWHLLNETQNKVVIIDRYIDSTLVYQALEGKLGVSIVQEIAKKTINLPLPDITFVLDIDPQQAQERLKKRKLTTERIYLVKADQTEEEVLTEVQDIIKQVYLPKKEVILPQYVRVVIQNEQEEFLVPGETPELAAKRELFEETNLVVENLKKITEGNTFYANLPKGAFSAFLSSKLLVEIGKIVKAGDLSYVKRVFLEELYSSHLREKLAQKYLQANFSQTQKAKFILSNYESDAITLSYHYRTRRNRAIQRENKHFEEIKDNVEYVKISGAEKKEIAKNKKLIKNDTKNMLFFALSKSLYATIPNYAMLKYLPITLLFLVQE